ncbi:MAG: hypothetical protein J6Y28_05180 [Acholeplasmatales bacterium]|nr:hypothetical protein [Acholeplasmatales bacterium]
MISGSMLILGAVAILAIFIGFGFLLGFLRGFRKSLFFTIVFIVVVVISFIFATALAKSVYSGSSVYGFIKGALPDKNDAASAGVNSLKEYVRFFIEHNFTEVLESGKTAGESMVANENGMAIIDGLIVMILKIFMLIGSYIILSILFYLVFGLIYLLFLRQKPYIETETTTNEDGEEEVTEKEVKPNKKRLSGGFIGAAKGFIKAMIILIPMSFAIGMVAQVEIPKNSSSTDSELRYASGDSNETLRDIVTACRQYDNSIGKMYCGLDDAIMDQIISYKVDGKKITLRKEVKGFINIYNAIEKNIGMDNIKDYDFKANINSPEMKAIVEAATTNISKSNATTTFLTAVGPEVMAILSDKADDNDADLALLFSEINLKDKDSDWWKDQIAQLNTIYLKFADMNLNLSAIDTKEYNKILDNTTSTSFDNFVDAIFENELLEMFVNGGLKYSCKKLPEGYEAVEDTTNQVIADEKVNEEVKSFSKLIDIIKRDIVFKDGSVDLDAIKLQTLSDVVDTEILLNSKITGKIVESLIKNTVKDITYNGESVGFDDSVFDGATFVIHNELKSLVTVLADGFTLEYSLSNLKDLEGTSKVGQICDMLDSHGLETSLICNELFTKLLPKVLKSITPDETYDDVTWPDEYKSISGVLDSIYGREESLSNISSLNFDTLTFRKLDNLADNDKVWNGKVVTKLLNSVAIPFVEDMIVNKEKVDIDYSKPDFKWRVELKNIVNLGLWASDTDGDITNDYNNTVGSLDGSLTDELGDGLLRSLPNNVPNSYILQDILSDSLVTNNLIGMESEITNWNLEMEGLSNVAVTMEDEVTHKLNLNTLNNITEVYKETVIELETNTHKSVILMNTMARTLAEPMSTPEMKDENDRSAWVSSKWQKEMPHIGDVLLTFAGDAENAKIVVADLDMDENSEIKFITLKSLETNIAYSEALENMFAKTLEDSIKDEENTIDLYPVAPEFDDEIAYSAWWDAEITGLSNVIYAEMGEDTTIVLNNFTDTETVKAKVVKSLYAKAIFRYVEDGVEKTTQKVKVYSDTFSQDTNVGVSEYLQYLFKPQLRDVSRRSTVETDPLYNIYYDFTETYNWDEEMEPIMNMFLITRMKYNSETEELEHIDDNTEIRFGDISFGLYDNGSTIEVDGIVHVMDGKEASIRNKERMTGIKNNIVVEEIGISYLQYILVPEMEKLMNESYTVENHKPGDWNNDDWERETNALDEVAALLMTEDNPKMSNLDFYAITDEQIDVICEKTAKSYLLQSKMAKSLVNAGINSTEITSVSSLTGEKDLMTYILEFEWVSGRNEAYDAIMDSLSSRRTELRDMKTATYEIDYINNKCTFSTIVEPVHEIVSIDGEGKISANGVDSFLTDSMDGKINAVKTYAEYSMMYKSLKENADNHPDDEVLPIMVNKVAERGSGFVYSED